MNPSPKQSIFTVWYLNECVLVLLDPLLSLMKGVAVHVQQSSTSPVETFQQLCAQHALHLLNTKINQQYSFMMIDHYVNKSHTWHTPMSGKKVQNEINNIYVEKNFHQLTEEKHNRKPRWIYWLLEGRGGISFSLVCLYSEFFKLKSLREYLNNRLWNKTVHRNMHTSCPGASRATNTSGSVRSCSSCCILNGEESSGNSWSTNWFSS